MTIETLTPTPAADANLGAALSSDPASNGASNPASASNPPAGGSQTADPAAPPKETQSQSYLALAKERKKTMDLQREIKEMRAQLAKRAAEPAPQATKKPGNPIEALQAAGFTYQDAADFLLNNEHLTPDQQVKAVRQEIEEMKKSQQDEREQAKKDAEERAVHARTEAETNFKVEIGDFISTNGETFELISQEDPEQAVGLIYSLIAAHYAQSVKEAEETGARPRILSVKEGAELAEKWYEERLERFNKTKKMQSRFQPKPADAAPGEGSRAPRTLANAANSGSAGGGTEATSDEERFERAMAAAERAAQTRKAAQT